MSPNPWPEPGSDGSPQPSQHHASLEDEQMIRHLASRYSPAELARLFQKVGGGPRHAIPDDQASIISTSTYQSSNLSEDAPSIFDSASSVRSFSDASSITSSLFSNVSSKLLGRKSGSSSAQAAAVAQAQVQAAHAQQAATWDDHETTPTPTPTTMHEPAAPSESSMGTLTTPKQKASFKCGFCYEEGIIKTCTRKNDLKRHIEDFHNMNAQWFCRHRGCQMVFDWQTAYKTHLKTAHGGSRMSLDEAKVNLCPQVVFACGFENCLQVFEAPGDAEASHTFKEYVSHVVKHFDEGAQSGEWSYTTRIRNLLRQAQVNAAWAECGWGDVAKARLTWVPQSSGVLRKRLECRHVGDVKLLVHYALQLGSDPRSVAKFREDFVTPIKDSCTTSGPGHVARKAPVAQQEAADPFNFRISRGSNPAFAQYINAQRRIYVPRHQNVRRQHPHPPRPPLPTSAPTSNPMAANMNGHNQMQHYFTSLPEAAQPSSPLYDSTQQPFSPTTASMMSPGGGIIADDLRSLRSFASGSPEPDVDMTDSPSLMGADFPASYTTSGMSSPLPDGLSSPVGLDHNAGFYHDDQQIAHHPHAY